MSWKRPREKGKKTTWEGVPGPRKTKIREGLDPERVPLDARFRFNFCAGGVGPDVKKLEVRLDSLAPIWYNKMLLYP